MRTYQKRATPANHVPSPQPQQQPWTTQQGSPILYPSILSSSAYLSCPRPPQGCTAWGMAFSASALPPPVAHCNLRHERSCSKGSGHELGPAPTQKPLQNLAGPAEALLLEELGRALFAMTITRLRRIPCHAHNAHHGPLAQALTHSRSAPPPVPFDACCCPGTPL